MIIKTLCEMYEAVARKERIFYRHYNTYAEIKNISIRDHCGEVYIFGDWHYNNYVSANSRNPVLDPNVSYATSMEDLKPLPLPEIRIGMCVGTRNADNTPGLARYVILQFDETTILAAHIPNTTKYAEVARVRKFDRKDGQTRNTGMVSLDLTKELKL